jgi:hypothetical protein
VASRWGPALALALLLTATVGLTGAPTLAGARPSEAPPEGITLTGAPLQGPAPLLVEFQASVPTGTSPDLDWSFGDGSWLNGTYPADAAPSHLYRVAGSFTAVATAVFPTGPVNASIPVTVRPTEPAVTVLASPGRGVAPLTVWLNGTVVGGTGTYVTATWTLGDGSNGSGLAIRVTYPEAGRFVATLTVVDSAGSSGSSSTVVNVSGAPAVRPSTDPPYVVVLTAPVTWALVVIGAVALVALVAWGRRGRIRGAPPSTVPPLGPTGPSVGPSEGLASPAAEPPAPRGPIDPALVEEAPTVPARLGALDPPTRLTHQLIQHLAGLPRVLPEDVPSRAWTQAGMAEALGVGQSAVSRVLRRLVAAGVVTVETRHLRDSDRRMKIYLLTARGERLGRALREVPSSGPPGPR